MSPYRIAIDQTTKAIDDRARSYRNLIVTVSALIVGSIGWAAVTRTFSPLIGLVLLFPICGFFFVLDGKLLNGWRSRLFEAWIKKDIDFRAFCDAVNVIPKLPKATVEAMLSTLPRSQDLVSEQKISSITREAVAATLAGMHADQLDTIQLKSSASAIVSFSIIAAVAWRTWGLLSGSVFVILLPLLGEWLKRKRRDALGRKLPVARATADFSDEKYQDLVGGETVRQPRGDIINR